MRSRTLALVCAAALLAAAALALDFPLLTPNPDAFKARRERFLAKLPPNSVAILHSAPQRLMSNDTDYVYRQDSGFYYLTGIEEPDTTAVLRANAADGKRYVLFVRGHDARREAFEGPRPGPDGAPVLYGADAAFASSEFSNRLAGLRSGDALDDRSLRRRREAVPRRRRRHGVGRTSSAPSGSAFARATWGPRRSTDAREIVNEMRLVKDAEEIRFLKRAAEMSARGHVLAMKAAAPGKWEFEVQQALDGYCSRQRRAPDGVSLDSRLGPRLLLSRTGTRATGR